MSRRAISAADRETEGTLRALRRAARRALELGIRTGTPVYVIKNGKIIDLRKQDVSPRKVKRLPRTSQSK